MQTKQSHQVQKGNIGWREGDNSTGIRRKKTDTKQSK